MNINGKSLYYGRCAGGAYLMISDAVLKDDAGHRISMFMARDEFLSFAKWVSQDKIDMLTEMMPEEDK